MNCFKHSVNVGGNWNLVLIPAADNAAMLVLSTSKHIYRLPVNHYLSLTILFHYISTWASLPLGVYSRCFWCVWMETEIKCTHCYFLQWLMFISAFKTFGRLISLFGCPKQQPHSHTHVHHQNTHCCRNRGHEKNINVYLFWMSAGSLEPSAFSWANSGWWSLALSKFLFLQQAIIASLSFQYGAC